MKVYIFGDKDQRIVRETIQTVLDSELIISEHLDESDIALAPLLNRKLDINELCKPKHGVLIFHPSLLPRHRGKDAIKWAYRLNENYSGATWFWADAGLDTGDICEMEVISIDYNKSPKEYYNNHVIPSSMRMLMHILNDIKKGIFRRRPQQHKYATYEKPIEKIYEKRM